MTTFVHVWEGAGGVRKWKLPGGTWMWEREWEGGEKSNFSLGLPALANSWKVVKGRWNKILPYHPAL